MNRAIIYNRVDANELIEHGIVETIRRPIDGTDMYFGMPWDLMSHLTMQAMRIVDIELKNPPLCYMGTSFPYSSLSVHFNDEAAGPWNFSLVRADNDRFMISTVSGARKGLSMLSERTSIVVNSLIQQSTSAGEI